MYVETYVAVSHRWETPHAPDSSGEQYAALQTYLASHPKVKWVWYDFAVSARRIRARAAKLRASPRESAAGT